MDLATNSPSLLEAVLLADPHPRQRLPPPRQLVAAPRQLLLGREQLEPRRQPLLRVPVLWLGMGLSSLEALYLFHGAQRNVSRP